MNPEALLTVIRYAHRALSQNVLASVNPNVQNFRTACSLAADEAALILTRFYMSPPANPSGMANEDGVWNHKPA